MTDTRVEFMWMCPTNGIVGNRSCASGEVHKPVKVTTTVEYLPEPTIPTSMFCARCGVPVLRMEGECPPGGTAANVPCGHKAGVEMRPHE